MADRLECRTATSNDMYAVVNIISAYGGMDYIGSDYIHMIEDPTFVGVIGELKGEVIAFTGAYIVNRGTTMMTKAGRVKESFQGLGVYRKLLEYLLTTIRKSFPDVMQEEFTVNTLSPLLEIPASKRKYQELIRTPVKYYAVARNLFLEEGETWPNTQVEPIGSSGLRNAFRNTTHVTKLFPSRLVINWHVYKPVLENVDIITRINNFITGSYSSEEAKNLELIIFGSWFQCEKQLEYNVDCYGKVMSHDTLVQHIKQHALKALSLCCGNINFRVFADSPLLEALDIACRSLGLSTQELYTTHCVVLTRNL